MNADTNFDTTTEKKLFSLEEETQLLLQYDDVLMRIVNAYMTQRPIPHYHRHDLYQEARLAFLNHIRRMDNRDEVTRFFIYVRYALSHFLEGMAPVHITHSKFSKLIKEVVSLPLESAEDEPFDDEEDILTKICIDEFMSTLLPEEQAIFKLILDGYRNREIMQETHFRSDSVASRYLSVLKQRFREFYFSYDAL